MIRGGFKAAVLALAVTTLCVYTGINHIHSNDEFLGFGDSIVELDLHSGCSRTRFSSRGAVYFGAIWRPGDSRAATPLSC